MPRRHTLQAVVFDLDDTLVLERHYVQSGFQAVAEAIAEHQRRNPEPGTRNPERQQRGRPDLAPGPAVAATLFAWLWGQFRRGRRERLFNALSDRFGLGLDQGRIDELVRLYRSHVPADLRPCPGVPALLRRLRRRGLKLGLLGDGYLPAQRLKLEACGLAGEFDVVVFTEDLGRQAWKPAPDGFIEAARRLGVPQEACAYVADNPAKDFLPANRLGWLSIQWRRRGQVHADRPAPPGGRPSIVVRSVRELLRALGG